MLPNRKLMLLIALLSLSACGGGGSSPSKNQTKDHPAIADTIAPTITLLGENPTYINTNETYTESGATAADNVDGALTVTINGNVDTSAYGSYTLEYHATDKAGNTTTVKRIVIVRDATPPMVRINGDDYFSLYIGQKYIEQGATAFDNKDGQLEVQTSGTVDTTKEGVYQIDYSSIDEDNNKQSARRTIRVIPDYKLSEIIKDENFLACLEMFGYSHASEATKVDCSKDYWKSYASWQAITHLGGIENLLNLTNLNLENTLSLSKDSLNSLVLTEQRELVELNLSSAYNDEATSTITSVDLSRLTKLAHLDLSNTSLQTIDISKNKELRRLYLSQNQLEELQTAQNEMLEVLFAYSNNLSAIDLTSNKHLRTLNLTSNKITDINLGKNTELANLFLHNNLLSAVELSNNTQIERLDVSQNKIKTLNLDKQTAMYELDLSLNPIQNLRLRNQSELKILRANSCNLDTLDTSTAPSIERLSLRDNKITTMDLTSNLSLYELELQNNELTELNLSNNRELTLLYLKGNQIKHIDISHNHSISFLELDNTTECTGISCNMRN